MLKDALAEGQNVDYKEVSFILGRLSALQKPELIPIVLESLERLYPVAHSVASFFKEFSALDQQTREHVAKVLLTPILDSNSVPPSEYYCIWILSLFHYHRDWNYAETLLRIFRETHSDAVRRYAAWRLRRLAPDLKLSRRPSTSAVHRRSVAPPFSSPLEEWVPTKENTCARVCA